MLVESIDNNYDQSFGVAREFPVARNDAGINAAVRKKKFLRNVFHHQKIPEKVKRKLMPTQKKSN